MNTAAVPFRKVKTNDPQIVVTGRLKAGEKNDIITFSIPLVWFEIVCIVNIPFADAAEAPVYVKFKVHRKAEQEIVNFVGKFNSTFYTNPRRAFASANDEDSDDIKEVTD